MRVGVVGLGKLWEGRHRAALGKLADRFQVTAIYDQVARRAANEAKSLRCVALDGLRATIARPDVDAVYLLNPQWFGLEAAWIAQSLGKPIFSALPVAGYSGELELLAASIHRNDGPIFVPEMARRFYPATLRLQELLASRLGRPRRIVGHARFFGYDRYGTPGPETQSAPIPLAVDPGGNLVDWCCFVMNQRPRFVQAFGGRALPGEETPAVPCDAEDYGGFLLDFGEGVVAQVTYERYHRSAWGEATRFLPTPGFQVAAENGMAWLEMPDRIQWCDSADILDERLPLEPSVGELVNQHFYRRLHGEHSLSPSIDDALAASRIVQGLLRSRRDHCRVDVHDP